MSKPGRNDPCYCGSGKKYKQCHLRIDQAAEREHREQGEAARFLRRELPGFARDERFSADFAAGLPFYWNAYYDVDNAGQMSEFEALRYLDWLVFDHKQEDGTRLIDVYAAELGDSLSPQQRELLSSWQKATPASAYELFDYDGQILQLRDVFTGEEYSVYEASGRGNVEKGEVILARLVPVFDRIEFSTVAAYLPGDESEGLEAYVKAAQEAAGDQGSTADYFIENNYLAIHYALQKAEEAGRPPVARLDGQRADTPIQPNTHDHDPEPIRRQRSYGSTKPHMAQTRRKAV